MIYSSKIRYIVYVRFHRRILSSRIRIDAITHAGVTHNSRNVYKDRHNITS